MSWIIEERDLAANHPDVFSSLFCVGNGASTTRGTLAEDGPGAYRGVYLSGLYTRAGWGLNYLLGGPNWLWARVDTATGRPAVVTESHRELDLYRGLLVRTAIVGDGNLRLRLREERFASWDHPMLMAQRISVDVLACRAGARLRLGLDGDVYAHPAKYYRPGQLPNVSEHGVKLTTVRDLRTGPQGLRMVLHSPQVDRCAAATARVVQRDGPALTPVYAADGLLAEAVYALPAGTTPGTRFTFDKACLLTGDLRNPGDALNLLDAQSAALDLSFEAALNRHSRAVAAFWHEADVEIDGDPPSQQAVRFALWSTRIAAPDDGGKSSIGAKNLTGDWDRGAVFWDMEMFQLPLLAATAPALARNHVLYRALRLPAARSLAAQDGYCGARFPWQSYATGLEEPPVLGGFPYNQQHVGLAVAWGVLHYAWMTGDDDTLLAHGLEVLIEVCRFFVSRFEPGADGRLHLRQVTGPDEDHQSIDDNAYTNRMASTLLNETARLVTNLRQGRRGDEVVALLCRLTVTDGEIAQWVSAAGRLSCPRLDNGCLAQFEGFAGRPEPDETLVGHPGRRADKPVKQADTLLLWQTVPHAMDDEDLAVHWREYAALCNQSSSQSYCTHALLAARAGRPRDAGRFLRFAMGIDLQDSGGSTRHGIHGAGEGGIWLAVVGGFGGLSVGADGLRIRPRLPPGWTRLSYPVRYRGHELRVVVEPGRFSVQNHGSEPVRATLAGKATTLRRGRATRGPALPMWEEQDLEAVIFDLDGVLVSTGRFHYLAWKELADELGIPFDEAGHHRLRGVSREEGLRRIYRDRPLPAEDELKAQCDRKNRRYGELIETMTPADVLPGALALLQALRHDRIRVAIASANPGARRVLDRTGLGEWTDGVADGTIVTATTPDPQVFYLAAQRLRVLPWNCVGVDADAAGIESIRRAGMPALGVGSETGGAHRQVASVAETTVPLLREVWRTADDLPNPYVERTISRTREDQRTNFADTLRSGAGKR